jgi:hypothetical protein
MKDDRQLSLPYVLCVRNDLYRSGMTKTRFVAQSWAQIFIRHPQ